MALPRINPTFRSNFDQLAKPTSVEDWVAEQVYKFLGNDSDHSDEIDACLTLEGPALENFVKQRFGSEGRHLHFVKELAAKKRRAIEEEEAALEEERHRRQINAPDDPTMQAYVKTALDDDEGGRGKKGKKGKPGAAPKVINATPASANVTVLVRTKSRHQKGSDAPVMVKGRMRCDCEAREHPLVQNCIQCGRIVCEAEGVGECLFCGSMVMGKGYQQAQLAPEAAGDFFNAVSHRNKLLEFQRNQARRTLVYDDQADYFSTNNSWMSAEERAYAQKKEADRLQSIADKRKVRVNFDFAGRRVMMTEAEAPQGPDDDQVFAELQSQKQPSDLANPSLERSPVFTPVLQAPPSAPTKAAPPSPASTSTPVSAAPASKSGKSQGPESRAGAVRQQAKSRVQYDYYSYNLEEGEDAAQSAALKASAAKGSASDGAFKICGVAETFSGGSWSLDDRRRVLQLMGQKRVSHYLFAPQDRLQYSHGWNWRSAIPLDVSDLPALGASAAQHQVQLNFSVPIGPQFDFASDQSRSYVAQFCLAAVRAGVRHLTLWFDSAHAAGEEQLRADTGAKKNAGLVHGDVCNRIFEAVRKGAESSVASSLCFYVCGAFTSGSFELVETMAKRPLYYLRDINQSLTPDVRLLLTEGEPVAKSLTAAYAQGARSFFGPKRTLILLDHYPANDYCPQVTFLHPYDGRDVGLEQYLDGLICVPMRRLESSLIPLATAFDYMRATGRYEPVLSLKDTLGVVLPDERLQTDMLELIGLSPSPISSTLVDATTKPVAEDQFIALRQKIGRVRSALPPALSADLSQFFILMDSYVETNLRELAVKKLRALKKKDDQQKQQLQEAERDFQSARKAFDAILKPTGAQSASPSPAKSNASATTAAAPATPPTSASASTTSKGPSSSTPSSGGKNKK